MRSMKNPYEKLDSGKPDSFEAMPELAARRYCVVADRWVDPEYCDHQDTAFTPVRGFGRTVIGLRCDCRSEEVRKAKPPAITREQLLQAYALHLQAQSAEPRPEA